jgi:nicotinate-nucleotide adenylyltransferase
MARWGVFGGSFDPIHRGHIVPVQEARRALHLERVVYLPTALSPHKPQGARAPALARFAMVELALLGEEGLFVSPLELTLGRPAYTVDTIAALRAEHSGVEWTLILGGDSFLDLARWRNWREIVAAVDLAVLPRPGWETDLDALSEEVRPLLNSPRVHVLQTVPVDVSSTRLRDALGRNEEPPLGAVPGLVLDYISKYNLYR